MIIRWAVSACLLLLAVSGCAHNYLAHDHIRQARTLTSIHEQQVLDNLAMLVQNPDALPFYSVPGAGSARVTDSGRLSASPLNGPGHTTLGPLQLGRDNQLLWATLPITDPIRLKRMQCAYRRAIGIGDGSNGCLECCEMRRQWEGSNDGDMTVCCDCCNGRRLKIEKLATKPIFASPCDKVGSYCGTHIRVCSESYADFNRLVTQIMDYAVNSPASKTAVPTMQVERYFYEEDKLVKKETYRANINSRNMGPNAGVSDFGSSDLEGEPVRFTEQEDSGQSDTKRDLERLQEFQKSEIIRNSIFPEF